MVIPALALTPSPWQQFIDPNGVPYSNGYLYVYEAGSEVPATVYQDSIGTPHTHPIILDALGSATIFLPASDRAFKFVLYDKNHVLIKSADNITWEFPENAPPIPGFNADLLDGIDSSGFLRVPLADSPKVLYLDADKLDGVEGAAYALKTEVQQSIDALRAELKAYTDNKVATTPTTYVPPRVGLYVSSANAIYPNCDVHDIIAVNALHETTTLANPAGTAEEGQPLTFRIRDNGVARALFWGAAFMSANYNTLPSATVVFKTIHCGFRWNGLYGKWQLLALVQEP